jgi:myo-inositol-1(or 4)-monophosphatase
VSPSYRPTGTFLPSVVMASATTIRCSPRCSPSMKGKRRVRASTTASLHDAIFAIGDYAVGDQALQKNRLRLAVTKLLADRTQRVRMLGSAVIDLAWLADGKIDGSITLSNKPWDTAAGVLLATEAGARVVDRYGAPHRFGSAGTIATTEALLADVLDLLREADGMPDSTAPTING